MKLIELLDSQAKAYLTGINLRSTQVEALNKLLTKNYQTDAKQALKDSNFADSMLSARQLHSLIINQAAGWILDILDGNWTPCPIPSQVGLNQATPIRWFRENGQNVAENIHRKKAMRAKAKADAREANKPEKEVEETFTSQDVETAKLEGKQEALKQVYAQYASDITPNMLLDLIEALDRQDRHRLLATLAAKYPTQASTTKRGKGTGNQATLPV